MSFSNLLKVKSKIFFPKQQNSQTNPIHRIKLGLKKGKYYCNQNDSMIANKQMSSNRESNQQKLSFRSLSKKKEEKSIFSKSREITQIHSQCFINKNNSDKNLFRDKNVQKKLNFNILSTNQYSSKQKKLNFSQIIKNSREKRQVEKSQTKSQAKKAIQPPLKQNSNFTKLKNRLISERSILDINQQKIRKEIFHQIQQIDRVRISTQIEQSTKNQEELDMNPIF